MPHAKAIQSADLVSPAPPESETPVLVLAALSLFKLRPVTAKVAKTVAYSAILLVVVLNVFQLSN